MQFAHFPIEQSAIDSQARLIFLSRTAHRNDVLTPLLPHLLPPTAGLDLARLIDRVISVREFYSAAASALRQGYNVNFSRHVDFLSFFFSPLFAAHTVWWWWASRPLRMHDAAPVADYYRDYHNYDNYVASASVIKRRPAFRWRHGDAHKGNPNFSVFSTSLMLPRKIEATYRTKASKRRADPPNIHCNAKIYW